MKNIVIFLTLFLVFTLTTPSLAAKEPLAQLTQKKNTVEIQNSGETSWQEAIVLQRLATGDSIRTGRESFAQINFADSTVIRMASLSRISLNSPKREVHFSLGKILMRFIKRPGESGVRVITPATVAAAVGTLWIEEIEEDGKVTIHVVNGTVEFTSGGTTINVSAGYTSSAISGEPPTPPQPFDITAYIHQESLFEGLEDISSTKTPIGAHQGRLLNADDVPVSANLSQNLGAVSPPIEPIIPVPLGPSIPFGPNGPPPTLPPWLP